MRGQLRSHQGLITRESPMRLFISSNQEIRIGGQNKGTGRVFILRSGDEQKNKAKEATGVRSIPLIHAYVVETASDEQIRITETYPDCVINFGDDKIDCDQKTVKIKKPDETSLMIQGDNKTNKIKIISKAKSRKELIKCDNIFLLHAINTKPEGQITDIPVVCDHPDVFPEELPGLPPDRQIEFQIKLFPGAKPVARSQYHLPPSELKELMKQIQES
ncbi:hypothetical protein L1987_40381 [Smallanthus sonchifolius]|uniref:Uncharacterized protein n=1 Tax=Smallanthus sonchifolius TaxID=185202 RepID=A0ACB9GTP8_9ASTR|nr:hypothetical protein L1987_40381 [Smallanthus sonchifolius]